MDISFNCPRCHQHLAVDESGAGMIVSCPSCNEKITIPSRTAPQPIVTSPQTSPTPSDSTPSITGINLKSAAILFGVVFLAIGIFGFLSQIGSNGHNFVHVAFGLASLLCGIAGVGASRTFFRVSGVVYAVVALLGFFYFGVIQPRVAKAVDKREAQEMRRRFDERNEAINEQISNARTETERWAAVDAAEQQAIDADKNLLRLEAEARADRRRYRNNMIYTSLQSLLAAVLLYLGFDWRKANIFRKYILPRQAT